MIAAYGEMADAIPEHDEVRRRGRSRAQAVLTTIGQVGPDQMELALTAVTNLASGMKIDLRRPRTMVAKAIGSGGESARQAEGGPWATPSSRA